MSKDRSFKYNETPFRFVSRYRGGEWDEGGLTGDASVVLNESACVLQYAQSVFEGLKARKTADGRIAVFRPDRNIARMRESCRRMAMPPFPDERFMQAIIDVVRANRELIPGYGTGGALYLRPFMIGTEPVLGVKPAAEFEFRIFASPVGAYFDRMIRLRVCDRDRAAPRGTGDIKAALNYAMSLYSVNEAHELGYDENLYLDAATRTYVEETGGANIFFVTGDGTLVVPKSGTILPSITRDSLLRVAELSGIPFEERRVEMAEAAGFAECGLCGTAAVISPVSLIEHEGTEYAFFNGESAEGSLTMRLKKTLAGIMEGDVPGPEGWILEI